MSVNSAQAQPAPWQPERLTPGWVFTPTVGLGGMWDSNVTVRNEGNPLVQEWVGIVNPRGEIDFNGRRTRFNAGYSGTLEAYRDVSELNRYEQKARIYGRHQATPRLRVEVRTSYTASPTTDRLELGAVPFVDIGGRSLDAGGGIALDLSPRTQFVADYRFQHITFDREDSFSASANAFLQGGYAHSPLARLTRSVSPRLSLGAEWEYRHATLDGGVQHFNVQTMIGEATYELTEHTTVSGGAGAAYLSVSLTDVDTWGPSFRAGLEHQIDRTTVFVRYNRSFVPSFSFGGLTGNQDISAGVQVPITSGGRLQFNGNVAYSQSEPVAELGVGFGLDSLWTSASLGYQVAPWLRTEGFLSHMHQTSTARGNIDRTRVGIQFVTFKPVRIQ
jgi:hypothetical protein